MTAAAALLDEMIATFRALEKLPEDVAKAAAPGVEAAVKQTTAAGQAPDGTPWLPKKDGGRALVNAAAAVTGKAVGSVIVVAVRGVEAFHHYGAGVPRRQIIPDPGTLPPRVAEAVRAAADRVFARAAR